MGSNKSTPKPNPKSARSALEPQRRGGKDRVASLMEAAAAVIAERGFESATMAEIASRAGAQIGSLYRFFPNKEVLADALFQRYGDLVDEAFSEIESQVASLSIKDLADVLLNLLVELHSESKAMIALLEARSDWSIRRAEFRQAALDRIAALLRMHSPHLSCEIAADVSVILLLNMKTMKALRFDRETGNTPGSVAELREMNRLYLSRKLSKRRASAKEP